MTAFNDTVLRVKITISSTKKTKQQCKYLIFKNTLNTKTVKSKHFIHFLKRFPQTLSVCFVMPSTITSKHNYQCFLIPRPYSCPKFQSLYIFKNRWLFPIQTCISLVLYFPFIWTRQEGRTKQQQNKKTHSQQQEAKSVRRRTAVRQWDIMFWRVVTVSLSWLASLHCLLHFLAFDWLRPAVLFFLNWTVCLFVKENFIWNYPK